MPPYSTSFGPKMPGIAAEVGGFSGILVSEVLHFLTGHWVQLGCAFNEEIEKWGFTREIISMGYMSEYTQWDICWDVRGPTRSISG